MKLRPRFKNKEIEKNAPASLDLIQRALRENEDWYEDLVQHSQDILGVHDLQGGILSINPAPARLLGYRVEELLQINLREIIAPQFRAHFDDYLSQVATGREARGLMSVLTRSGERRIWQYHSTLRTSGVPTPIARVTAHDVTEQKRAEKLLRASHDQLLQTTRAQERTLQELKLFRTLLDQSNDAIMVVDPETLRLLDFNERTCSKLGYSREELLSMTIYDIAPGFTPRMSGEVLRQIQESGFAMVEREHRRKDGITFPVEVNLREVQLDRLYRVAVSRDISARKLAEERLRASETRYRALHDRSPIGICWIESKTGRFLGVNPKYCEITGRSEQDLLGRDFQSITHPGDLAINLQKLSQLVAGQARHYELQKRYIRPDGSIRWVEVEVVAMWNVDGRPDWHMAIVQDVTDRKRQEERLQEYERVVEGLEEMIVVLDRDYRYVIANRSFLNNLGMEKDQVIGHRVQEIVNSEVFETVVKEKVDECFRGNLVRYEMNYKYPKLGERRLVLAYYPIEGPTVVDRIACVVQDVTERTQAEEALRRSEESYRLFVSQSSEGIFRQDLDRPIPVDMPEDELVHRILHDSYMADCNDALAKMYGLTGSQECVGKRLTEMLPPDDPLNIELTRHYIRSGFRVIDRESHEVDIEGRPKVFLNSMIGLVENGMLVRTWGIQRDVTEKVELENARREAEIALRQSEQRFRIALDGSPIKVFNQDRELRYTWVYNVPEGWSERDYLGKTDEDIFEPEVAAQMLALKRSVLESGKGDRRELALPARGKIHYCDITVEPLRDAAGAIVGVNCACVDITHLREITEELRLAKEKLSEEKLYLEQTIDTELGFGEILGRSNALKEVMLKVARVAPGSSTVLVLGETGTGKELVARAIHRQSQRKDRSFIKMNCAAIPSGLLESELFGHEKGAFTGAIARKIGRLELADEGTLFLDEIGEVPLELQPKLLRVLQDREFERLGGIQTIKVDFRLIAATNRDLRASVSNGQFRSDLYYRLNVFPIQVPALRERRDDIPILVEHFVRKYAAKMGKSILSIPTKTMETLTKWEWPGNIRELENFVERSAILTPGSVLNAPLAELRSDQPKKT